ncbi:uncharacterized protein [Physcomitrium patens]|uniref:uncharacterized protein n=1 Tax=Physcomitrium patens TaxID=3218 RepID=UPI000D17D010|nr:short transient receptor potential channel 4-associated protein-like [Physcomitrium patens]|eukprot:XP_024386452.1 short transient receptor potential channel 4-associated protein-like [Physcomitrella patens]
MRSRKQSAYGCLETNGGDTGTMSRKDSASTMLKVLIRAQTTGNGYRALRQLPAAIYCRRGGTSQDTASLCIELESALVANDVNYSQEALANLAQNLFEWNNPNHQSNREAFVLFGGDIVLLRALLLSFPILGDVDKLSFTLKVLYIRNECLNMLRELCFTVHPFIEYLAADEVFVVKLFDMMRFRNTFNTAVNLAEEIMAIRKDLWQVQDVPNFTSLVCNFSLRQLASFCRVLEMVIIEPEERSLEICVQQESRSEEPAWTTTDKNHEAILLVPDILSHLVKLFTLDKVSSSREVRQLSTLSS